MEPADFARFDAAILPHLNAAHNLARHLTGSASDADDVVQDACLRALRHFGGFIGTDGRDHVNMQFKQNQHQLKVDVKLNQGGSDVGSDGGGNNIQQTYEASSVTRVVSYLLGGDDHYNGSDGGADIPMSQFVFGDSLVVPGAGRRECLLRGR